MVDMSFRHAGTLTSCASLNPVSWTMFAHYRVVVVGPESGLRASPGPPKYVKQWPKTSEDGPDRNCVHYILLGSRH